MTTVEEARLEEEILEIINCNLCDSEYIGKLKVWIDDDPGSCNECHVPVERWYQLFLYMNQEQSPMAMGYQGTEEGFKKFVAHEISTRQMQRVSYWRGIMTLPTTECDENCNCGLDFDNTLIL